jgi:hypothetical protein
MLTRDDRMVERKKPGRSVETTFQIHFFNRGARWFSRQNAPFSALLLPRLSCISRDCGGAGLRRARAFSGSSDEAFRDRLFLPFARALPRRGGFAFAA